MSDCYDCFYKITCLLSASAFSSPRTHRRALARTCGWGGEVGTQTKAVQNEQGAYHRRSRICCCSPATHGTTFVFVFGCTWTIPKLARQQSDLIPAHTRNWNETRLLWPRAQQRARTCEPAYLALRVWYCTRLRSTVSTTSVCACSTLPRDQACASAIAVGRAPPSRPPPAPTPLTAKRLRGNASGSH